MKCLLSGHNFKEIARGEGYYADNYGIILARNVPMILFVCTKCGKEKIV